MNENQQILAYLPPRRRSTTTARITASGTSAHTQLVPTPASIWASRGVDVPGKTSM
ncbi:MAG TPA: hypothetical protein VMS73_07790 [Anaerolineaceae bacterium]|nr:hypothetical protein [Anaerolineaceae bacterium]